MKKSRYHFYTARVQFIPLFFLVAHIHPVLDHSLKPVVVVDGIAVRSIRRHRIIFQVLLPRVSCHSSSSTSDVPKSCHSCRRRCRRCCCCWGRGHRTPIITQRGRVSIPGFSKIQTSSSRAICVSLVILLLLLLLCHAVPSTQRNNQVHLAKDTGRPRTVRVQEAAHAELGTLPPTTPSVIVRLWDGDVKPVGIRHGRLRDGGRAVGGCSRVEIVSILLLEGR